MIRQDDLLANTIDSSIGDFIAKFPELFEGFAHVLITSLDSTRQLQEDGMIKDCGVPHRFLNGGVVFEGKAIKYLHKMEEMFSGFDELWCFRTKVVTPLPSGVELVSPFEITTEITEAVKHWMRESKCILGLGDGTGLNYVTTDEKVAIALESMIR